VRHQRRRRPEPHYLTSYRLCVLHLPEHIRGNQLVRLRRPGCCHLCPNLRQHLRVRVQQRHRPQQRRRGRVLRRKEKIKEVATDFGVGGERCRRLSGELGLLDFPQRFLHPVIN